MAAEPTIADVMEALVDFRDGVGHEFERVHLKLAEHDGRFDMLERRLDLHDRRFSTIDDRLDRMDERFDRLEGTISEVKGAIANIGSRVEHLERKFA